MNIQEKSQDLMQKFSFKKETTTKLFAVIVLYKVTPKNSISYQTLSNAIKYISFTGIMVKIFFYDNTPGKNILRDYPENSEYEAPGENNGISIAYNKAIEIAYERGFDWLLTLDQDTQLPIDFLEKLFETIKFVNPIKQIAAIVPLIYDGLALVSPNADSYTYFPKKFSEEYIGVSLNKNVSAFNSASTLRISSLRLVGGYDPKFWLDYSDAVMYHRLQISKMKVFVSGNIKVQHELSVMDMKNRVSLQRYEGILSAESAYCDECLGWIAATQLIIRLIYRSSYKFIGQRDGLKYAKIALRHLYMRIFYSKKHRLHVWKLNSL